MSRDAKVGQRKIGLYFTVLQQLWQWVLGWVRTIKTSLQLCILSSFLKLFCGLVFSHLWLRKLDRVFVAYHSWHMLSLAASGCLKVVQKVTSRTSPLHEALDMTVGSLPAVERAAGCSKHPRLAVSCNLLQQSWLQQPLCCPGLLLLLPILWPVTVWTCFGINCWQLFSVPVATTASLLQYWEVEALVTMVNCSEAFFIKMFSTLFSFRWFFSLDSFYLTSWLLLGTL